MAERVVVRGRTRAPWYAPVMIACTLVPVGLAVANAPGSDASPVAGLTFLLFLGVAALTARARGVAALTSTERSALVVSGAGGVLGLLGHPALLQVGIGQASDLLFIAGAAVFGAGVVAGGAAVARRERRDTGFVIVYAIALLFFLPVWLFDSPYAAVAGLTIAHGLQYLVLMTMVASGSPDRTISLLVLLNVALFAGVGLNALSHQHGHGMIGQTLFGAFLGLSMSHFVIDAGLWRLREEFPRRFLRERLPYLLATP